MGSMAQDAIDFGLDPVVGPDGREWCDSSYGQSSTSREIWGNLKGECGGGYNGRSETSYSDDNADYEAGTRGHSKSVWEKKGYRVRSGETYAYKYFGNEIYTKDQVIKKSSRSSYGRKKSYTKARESESYTYDEWLELGYQVRKGEKTAYRSGGSYYFNRDQVAWIG